MQFRQKDDMSVRLGSPVPTAMNPSGITTVGERKKMSLERDIFISRILTAIFSNIVLQCVFVSLIALALNFDFFHPFKWIQDTSKTISSLRTWINLLPLAVITFAQGVLMSRDYVAGASCVKTRFGIFCTLFHPRSIIIAVINVLLGVTVVLYYSALFGDSAGALTKICDNPAAKCLNERNMFLIVGGIWVGLYSFLKRQVWETHVLIFPLIHQFRYPQIKNQLSLLIHQSLREAVLPTFYLLLVFAWLEGLLREHLSGFLGVATDNDPLKSLWSWIHISLFARSFLFSSLSILSGHTMEMLFQVFFTEVYHFPISSTSDECLTMPKALASRLPLLQQLGCLDILHVAERDPLRRRELFSLSLPGGHPHNWNGVSTELLKTVASFTAELNSAASDMNRAANGPLLSTSTHKIDAQTAYNASMLSAPAPVPFSSSSCVSPTSLRMRNMSLLYSPDMSGSFIANSPTSQIMTAASADQRKSAIEAIKLQIWNLLEWIRRKPGINLLFGEIEDAAARYLLIHSQHLTWVTQALALLAAASLTKDSYGVVQKDIPSIIKALVNLKNTLDRLPLYSHKRALRLDSLDIRMKAALSSSVKRSLYILCDAFGPYLSQLPLSEDVRQQLTSFVSFKEG